MSYFSYSYDLFIHPFSIHTSLNVLVTLYVALLAPRKMALGFPSPVSYRWSYILHPRGDFIHLGSLQFPVCLRETPLSPGSVNITAADGWPSSYVFYGKGWSLKHIFRPLPHLLVHRPFLEDVELRLCSGSHFRKLTFV